MNFLEEETSQSNKKANKLNTNKMPKEISSSFVTSPSSSPSPSSSSSPSSSPSPSSSSSPSSSPSPSSSSFSFSSFFDFKTILILFLFAFLLLILLGINIFTILGNSVNNLSDVLGPFIKNFMKALGYSTGTVINTSADTVSDVAKTSIDIAEGSVQNIGNLLISASGETQTPGASTPAPPAPPAKSLEETVQKNTPKTSEPNPDNSSNPIQKPISADKSSWCLVGEYQNKRGCVPVTESDKCLSGQIFPNQAMCLNPTLTP